MAKHHLDAPQVGTGFEKVGGKAVSKGVGRYTFLDAGPDGGFVHGLPDDLSGYRFVRTRVVHSAGEQVGLGSHPAVVLAQRVEYPILEATTSEEALQLFNECGRQVDLLVTNLKLQTSSGIEVALALRSALRN